MKENQNQQNISAPPEPQVTIRTLDSDVKAIEQGGGEMVAPRPVIFEETKIEAGFDIPGYIGPEKAIFTSTATIIQENPVAKKSAKWKITGIIIGILAIIIVFGLLGYFVISSWFFPKEMPAVQ